MKGILSFAFLCAFAHAENIVINGQPILTDTAVTAPIVELHAYDSDGNSSLCTGTFVNKSTIITASHCVRDNPFEIKVGRVYTRNYFVNSAYLTAADKRDNARKVLDSFMNQNSGLIDRLRKGEDIDKMSKEDQALVDQFSKLADTYVKYSDESGQNDFAVIVLEPDDARNNPLKKYYKVAKSTSVLPSVDDYMFVAGFGAAKFDPTEKDPYDVFGQKNMGYVKLTSFQKDQFYEYKWFQNAPVSFIGPGDSGSALIKCSTGKVAPTKVDDCATFEMVGVNITVATLKDPGGIEMRANSVDITSKAAQDFFNSTIHCNRSICAEPF